MWLDFADLSDHCPVILLQMLAVWLCQWPSLIVMEHCTLHTRAVHVAMHLEKEVWEERTGSSSLNFFQAVFTRVVIESSQPSAAESMSPRLQEEATIPSLMGSTWTFLCGLPSKLPAVPWHCVHL